MSKEDIVGSTEDTPGDTVATATNPKKSKRFSAFVWSSLYVVLCLGWIAPIVALLILNFKNFIVGASISCAVRSCNDNFEQSNWTRTSEKLDLEDHDILGALQLVAKTLEIWFIFLAGSLVFDLTMLLARRGNVSFRNHSSLPHSRDTQSQGESPNDEVHGESILGSEEKKTRKSTIFSFLLFVVAVSIVCNLMGPATAVLLIPTLVWRVDPISANQEVVVSISASGPPASTVILTNCLPDQLASGQYSCAADEFACIFWAGYPCVTQSSVLDGMLLHVELEGFGNPFIQTLKGELLRFTLFGQNAPLISNLQTLQYLANDYDQYIIVGESNNYTQAVEKDHPIPLVPSLYDNLRNAQQVQLQRQGPGYLSETSCDTQLPYFSIEILEDKVIRCYSTINGGPYTPISSSFQDSQDGTVFPVSTLCIRTGSGWDGNNPVSQFFIANNTSPSQPVTVNTYSSNKAIYLNSTTYHCATSNATTGSAGCDWDSLFLEEPSELIKNITINPSVVEYIWSDGSTISWCSTFTFLRYPTYIMDTAITTNPYEIASLFDNGPLTESDEPIFVHPDWSLAGWSVDKGDTIPANQARAQVLVNYIRGRNAGGGDLLALVQEVIAAQILSQIDYVTEAPSTNNSRTLRFRSLSIASVSMSMHILYSLGHLSLVLSSL